MTSLPIDADETTCVPVEIVYAERPSGQAVVLYADGREEWTAATAESIAAFVHNHHKPANEWQVDRVIVESNRPLRHRRGSTQDGGRAFQEVHRRTGADMRRDL